MNREKGGLILSSYKSVIRELLRKVSIVNYLGIDRMVVIRHRINVNYGSSVKGADYREQHAKDYSSEANCED